MPLLAALLLASLAMSTSPAAIVRVVNEQRSSGQVTERVLHLTAVNCVLAVLRVQGRRRLLDLPDLRQCLAGGFEQSDRARRLGRRSALRSVSACRRCCARFGRLTQRRDRGVRDRRGLAGRGGAHLQGLAGAGRADLRLRRAPPPRDAEPGAARLRRAGRPARRCCCSSSSPRRSSGVACWPAWASALALIAVRLAAKVVVVGALALSAASRGARAC